MSAPQVSLTNETSGTTTDLYSVEQSKPARQSDPRVDSIYSFDSEDSFLVGLEEQEQVELVGRASGNRLSNSSSYSSDPQTALGQYAARLLSKVNGNQGASVNANGREVAWTLSNNYTGRTLPVVVEEVDVIRNRTEVFEFKYSLTLRVGQSMMPHEPIDPNSVNIANTAYLGNRDLHEIEQLRVSKRQKLETHTYVTAGGSAMTFEDAQHQAMSGATKEVTIRGNVPGSESDRGDFDDYVRNQIGQDKTVTYNSAFPGDSINAMVSDFESTREAGITRLGSYSMTLIEGRTSTYEDDGTIKP